MAGESPLRVAVVGSGPAGFYATGSLLAADAPIEVDLIERLPTPWGLVRLGVAPDHPNIKAVSRVFEKTAQKPGFRFLGNVDVGRDVSHEELVALYDAVVYAFGAQTDRRLGIPGEDLPGSWPATEFVAWYNGHPDYRDLSFDLSAERIAVVGVGNVAVDVARILAKSPEELAATDIADHALEALRQSRVREVYLLGRRGPAQAAFTNPEVKELGELEGADIQVLPGEVALDPLSEAELAAGGDASARKKIEILQEYARRPPSGKPKRLTLRFLVSPTEILGDARGQVQAIRLVRNRLVAAPDGSLKAEPTGETEELPVGLVFRSVGYKGLAIPGLPFEPRRGTVPHDCGRVIDPATGARVTGCYVSGWIKRGPSGVIGTNKPCAAETAESMLADASAGTVLQPTGGDIEPLLRDRQPDLVTWPDWVRLNEAECAAGKPSGRPRVKLTRVADMLKAIRT